MEDEPENINDSLQAALKNALIEQLRDGVDRIEHCVGQLSDEQIWWRPLPEMNSIANLLLHLAGNVRQWMIVGLREEKDLRQRQSEFDDRSMQGAEQLMTQLKSTVDEACTEIQLQTVAMLIKKRHVQEFDVNGLQAILDSTCHFQGHVQEIIHMSRFLKRDTYEFRFVPKNEASNTESP